MQNIQPAPKLPKAIANHPDERASEWFRILREISQYQHRTGNASTSPKLVMMICAWLDIAIGRDNRLDLLTCALGRKINTCTDLQPREKFGLVLWCNPWKEEIPDGKWQGGVNWEHDLYILRMHYGQTQFDMTGAGIASTPETDNQ